MTRHYLDHASTAPLRPEAREAMVEWLDQPAADPARLYGEAHAARAAIEHSRAQVAAFFGCRSRSVIFTSGATEAIASACHGAAEHRPGAPFVASPVEHSAVRKASERRAEVISIPVDRYGVVDLDALRAALRRQPALVHLQWGNHEVGTLQPVAQAATACRDAGVLLHVDAAQAAGRAPIAFDALGIDLMAVSSHKLGGPAGIGALLVRRGLRLEPLLVGADQERARRAGFENLPAIMGFGAVCEALADPARLSLEIDAATALRARIDSFADRLGGVTRYGPPADRLPHISCLGIDGVEPQGVVVLLDQKGIAVHSGSSCASETIEPSPVLEAMGADAHRSLRISVGWSTLDADIDAVEQALGPAIDHLRSLANRG